jgi:hypothetical protein
LCAGAFFVHLLEEDGDEARVEGADEAHLRRHALGDAHQRFGVVRLRDEADAARLVRAEEDVGDELGHRGREEVDRGLRVPRGLLADRRGDVDLEELDAAELEPTLDEVALRERERSRKSASRQRMSE